MGFKYKPAESAESEASCFSFGVSVCAWDKTGKIASQIETLRKFDEEALDFSFSLPVI